MQSYCCNAPKTEFMNKLFRVCLFSIGSILFFSCQKELSSDEVTGGSDVRGTLRMKIDGTQWVANTAAGASIDFGLLSIYGISKDKKELFILLEGASTQTYSLDEKSLSVAALVDSTEADPYAYTTNQADITKAGGTVKLTSIDVAKRTVSGTFEFKMFRDFDNKQKVITEGVFENLSYAPVTPPGGSTDTLKVKINGVDLKPDLAAGLVAFDQIAITGSESGTLKSVGLFIPKSITVGTYDIGSIILGSAYTGIYNASATLYMASESGKLTILEHNTSTKRIRGNFEFKAVEFAGSQTAQLTSGYFSVKYN